MKIPHSGEINMEEELVTGRDPQRIHCFKQTRHWPVLLPMRMGDLSVFLVRVWHPGDGLLGKFIVVWWLACFTVERQ